MMPWDARSGMLASERGSAPPEAATVVAGGLGPGQGKHTTNQGGYVREGVPPYNRSASTCEAKEYKGKPNKPGRRASTPAAIPESALYAVWLEGTAGGAAGAALCAL